MSEDGWLVAIVGFAGFGILAAWALGRISRDSDDRFEAQYGEEARRAHARGGEVDENADIDWSEVG